MTGRSPDGDGPVWVGIDLGTTGVKVVLSDAGGREVDADHRRYAFATDGHGVEQDADAWWAALVGILPALVSGRDVRAVAVTSQGPTLVPVDGYGDPTGPALLWADRRAQTDADRIRAWTDDEIVVPDAYFGTAKLGWLARERPEQVARARHVLSCNGFVVSRLTGQTTLDVTTASLMQAWVPEDGAFDGRLAEHGVPMHLLPPVHGATEIVGEIGRDTADLTGLPRGCPVAAGAIDAVGTALESAVLAPGDPFAEMTGFSTVGMVAVPRGVRLPGFLNLHHCFPDTDLVLTAQVTSGAVIDWLVATLAGGASLLDPDLLAGRARPNPVRMVPSLAGERTPTWATQARGSLTGVHLSSTGADLVVAAMEGVALALGADIAALVDRGIAVDRVLSTGGGSRNATWLQIKADVLGVPVQRPVSGSGAAHGAAFLAGLAVGEVSGRDQLRAFAGPVTREYRPDPARTAAYRERLVEFIAQRDFANALERAAGGATPSSA